MSAPELLAALGPLVDVFERLGVAYEIGGSLASSAHGVARATLDVDLVADLRPEHAAALVAALQGAYYVDRGRVDDAILRRRSFNAIHLATMLKLDVFARGRRTYDAERARRAREDSLEDRPGARRFWITSAEDIVLAKLEWFRSGGGVSERQWGDVTGVIKAQGPALDRDYLWRWAAELGVDELLERALTEAGPG